MLMDLVVYAWFKAIPHFIYGSVVQRHHAVRAEGFLPLPTSVLCRGVNNMMTDPYPLLAICLDCNTNTSPPRPWTS